MGRKYNIVIFGGTGFTGKHVILAAVKTLDHAPKDERFSWAIAGRSESKLERILQELAIESGRDLKDVDVIIADISDVGSLRRMAQQCDVLLNCAGPYILYGEEVVKACIAEGTHHLDLSGEPQFLENVQLKYDCNAKNSGSFIIGACGFDSIPADYGSIYLEKNFDGQLNSVESYLQCHKAAHTPKINFGTYHSAVISCHKMFEILSLYQKLYPNPYFRFQQYKLSYRPIKYSDEVNGWCVQLAFPDGRVMERTQRYKYYFEKRRPVQTRVYMKLPSLFAVILLCIGFFFIGVLSQFKFGVRLLENYPGLFSFGKVTKKGPTKEEMDVNFTFTLVGKGWDKSVKPDSDGLYPTLPNKTMTLKVQGNNPGYSATAIMMLHAGLTIIKERALMPSKGGVYTPGIAFGRTTLAERLTRHGVTFITNHPKH